MVDAEPAFSLAAARPSGIRARVIVSSKTPRAEETTDNKPCDCSAFKRIETRWNSRISNESFNKWFERNFGISLSAPTLRESHYDYVGKDAYTGWPLKN